jgi:hypothetical protein
VRMCGIERNRDVVKMYRKRAGREKEGEKGE